MSCKAGNQKHKERCKKYKQEGRREVNKVKKQEKHKKRMAKFLKRKEEGKTYSYVPNPFKKNTKEYAREANKRKRKNKSHKLDIAIWDSLMRKTQNIVDKEKALEKIVKEEKSGN